jgi:hypothetical protein
MLDVLVHNVTEPFHTSAYIAPLRNPFPFTFTFVPTIPVEAENVNEGVIVKLALGWLGPWVAVMLTGPPGPAARTKVQAKVPPELVVIVVPMKLPTEQLVGDWTIRFRATVAPELSSNSEPVTVNVLPTVAWPGDTEIVGTVTTNVESAD